MKCRQAEVAEHDALLHQRVRADHHGRFPGGNLRQRQRARLAGDLACEHRNGHVQRLQPPTQVGQVLFGEQFGGRHQRNLAAGFHRGQRSERRDDGLAAADIALHQAQHRLRLGDVGQDLRIHA